MKAADRLVLPADLVFMHQQDLPPEVVRGLAGEASDIVLSRPHSRARSVVIDASAAAFLQEFREPSTVVEAVLRHADATGEAPEAILNDAAPLLAHLRHQRFVAVVGEADADGVAPLFAIGKRILGLEIVRCVHLFENVEVYRATLGSSEVALKMLRPGASADSHEMLEREAAILGHLAGSVAPDLVARGEFEGRPYLIETWCDGPSASHAASRLRSQRADLGDLVALCTSVIGAYVELHTRGVIHGDVHPGNVRIGRDGRVRLVDFGLSISPSAQHLPVPRRGGLADYFEPEYREALIGGRSLPAATAKSDQYALAALVYLMLTGRPRHEVRLDRSAWLQQSPVDDVIALDLRELQAGGIEDVLRTALSPDPAARFVDVARMLDAFIGAGTSRVARTNRARPDFLADVIGRYAPRGLPPTDAIDRIRAPRCSITYGGAGIAWFLYRLACLRGDPRLLTAADVWAARAHARARNQDAFASAEIRITDQTVGAMSPFHYVGGLHLVDALIAAALGDARRASRSAAEFAAACSEPGPNPDLTLGWSSVLLGCATLVEALPRQDLIDISPVVTLGQRSQAAVASWLTDHRPGDAELPWYGIAHGWAGLLYAQLRWTQATKAGPPREVRTWFDALTGVSRKRGDRIWWPVKRALDGRDSGPQTGWCHGSAGYLLLWTLAAEVVGPDFLEFAQGAASHLAAAFGRDGNRNASLCCGLTGQGYGLLSLYRATGDMEMLDLATEVAARATELSGGSSRPDSLYKGDVGIAALIADLERSAFASTPLFETEAWGRDPK